MGYIVCMTKRELVERIQREAREVHTIAWDIEHLPYSAIDHIKLAKIHSELQTLYRVGEMIRKYLDE